MLTLEHLSQKTEKFWTEDGVKIPPMSVQVKDHMAAYKEAGCNVHEGLLWFNGRCQQAKAAGFEQVTDEQIVRMLTGDYTRKVKRKQDHYLGVKLPWFYDHLFEKEIPGAEMPSVVFTPPFWSKATWQIRMVPINYLKCHIPYGVLLKLNELKKLKFFNCFFAFAPEELIQQDMYVRPEPIDPVIVATLVNKQTVNNGHKTVSVPSNADFAHFFVAKW